MSSVSRHDDFLSRLRETSDRHDAAEEAQRMALAEREAQRRRAAADPMQGLLEAIESVRMAAAELHAAAEESRQVTAEMLLTFKAFINDLDRRLR